MIGYSDELLHRFVKESNRIEGIARTPSRSELRATRALIDTDEVTLTDVCAFVSEIAPGHVLRDRIGFDVRVGDHVPPPGGPRIRSELRVLLETIRHEHPYEFHNWYESLHPFTDGNGRSGRALWAWQMVRRDGPGLGRGFLHEWYYQSLSEARRNGAP